MHKKVKKDIKNLSLKRKFIKYFPIISSSLILWGGAITAAVILTAKKPEKQLYTIKYNDVLQIRESIINDYVKTLGGGVS